MDKYALYKLALYKNAAGEWSPSQRALFGAGVGGVGAWLLHRLFGGKRKNVLPWILGGAAAGGLGGYNWDTIQQWWNTGKNKGQKNNQQKNPSSTAPTNIPQQNASTAVSTKSQSVADRSTPMVDIPSPPNKYTPDKNNKKLPSTIRQAVEAQEKQKAEDELERFNTSSQGIGRTYAFNQAEADRQMQLKDINYQIKAFEQNAPALIESGQMSKEQVAATYKALNDQRLHLIRSDTRKSFIDARAKQHYNTYVNNESREAVKRKAHMANMKALQAMPEDAAFNAAREKSKNYIDMLQEVLKQSGRIPQGVTLDYDNAINAFANRIMNNENILSPANAGYTAPMVTSLLYPGGKNIWTGSRLEQANAQDVADSKALDSMYARGNGILPFGEDPQRPMFE